MDSGKLKRKAYRLMGKPVHTVADMESICKKGASPVLYHGKVTGWQMRKSGEEINLT